MMRVVEFTEPVYHSIVTFLYGTSADLERWGNGNRDSFAKVVADHMLAHGEEFYLGRCSQVARGRARVEVIWVKPSANAHQLAVTIAHECLHAVHSVLDDRGLKFSNDSQEAYAYLHSYFMTECLAATRPKRKRRAKRRSTTR